MLKKLIFTHNAFMNQQGNFVVSLIMDKNNLITAKLEYPWDKNPERKITLLTSEDSKKIVELIEECALWTWNREYKPEGYEVFNGFSWDLVYEDKSEIIGFNENVIKVEGSNAYPWCFYKLINAVLIAMPELTEQLEYYAEEKQPVYGY